MGSTVPDPSAKAPCSLLHMWAWDHQVRDHQVGAHCPDLHLLSAREPEAQALPISSFSHDTLGAKLSSGDYQGILLSAMVQYLQKDQFSSWKQLEKLGRKHTCTHSRYIWLDQRILSNTLGRNNSNLAQTPPEDRNNKTLSNSSCKTNITLIPKSDENIIRKEITNGSLS